MMSSGASMPTESRKRFVADAQAAAMVRGEVAVRADGRVGD